MNICPNMYICLLYICIYICMLIVFIRESHVVFVYVLLLYSLFVCLLYFCMLSDHGGNKISYLILSEQMKNKLRSINQQNIKFSAQTR